MSKLLDDVQAGREVVITRHGKPEGALVSAAQLYRYRELERLVAEFTEHNVAVSSVKPEDAQKALMALTHKVVKLLRKAGDFPTASELPTPRPMMEINHTPQDLTIRGSA
jgi:prevent-host-death family protein